MRKLIIITSLFLIIAQVFAQTDSIEVAQTKANGILKELFMFKMAKDVIEIRGLISDNELGDSVENYMTNYDNALFFKSTLDYDFFWNSVLGRKKYKVPSSQLFLDSKGKYLEKNEVGTSIDFDIVLTPNWEDPSKENKLKDYSVKITPSNYTNLSFSDDEEESFNTVLNSPFATNVTTPKDAKVNEAVFNGLAELRVLCKDLKKDLSLDVDLADIIFSGTNNKKITEKFSDYACCYFGSESKESKLEVEFSLNFKRGQNYKSNKLYVKTEVKQSDNVLVDKTTELYTYDENKQGFVKDGTLNFEIPDKVALTNDINCTIWTSSSEEGEWQKLGVYTPSIYVTYNEPSCTVNERYLYFGCNKAQGALSAKTCLENIWNQFALKKIYLKDFGFECNTNLTYYSKKTASAKIAKDLLLLHDGQCTAWTDLFVKILYHQGFGSESKYKCDIKTVTAKTEDEIFLVKNWKFKDKSVPINTVICNNTEYSDDYYEEIDLTKITNGKNYTHLNYRTHDIITGIASSENSYGWTKRKLKRCFLEERKIKTISVIDVDGIIGAYVNERPELNGVEGQGKVKNPLSIFGNHSIVELSVEELPQYYDPSYGVTYTSDIDMQNKAIAGFFIQSEKPYDVDNLNLDQETKRLYHFFFRKCSETEIEIDIK